MYEALLSLQYKGHIAHRTLKPTQFIYVGFITTIGYQEGILEFKKRIKMGIWELVFCF